MPPSHGRKYRTLIHLGAYFETLIGERHFLAIAPTAVGKLDLLCDYHRPTSVTMIFSKSVPCANSEDAVVYTHPLIGKKSIVIRNRDDLGVPQLISVPPCRAIALKKHLCMYANRW